MKKRRRVLRKAVRSRRTTRREASTSPTPSTQSTTTPPSSGVSTTDGMQIVVYSDTSMGGWVTIECHSTADFLVHGVMQVGVGAVRPWGALVGPPEPAPSPVPNYWFSVDVNSSDGKYRAGIFTSAQSFTVGGNAGDVVSIAFGFPGDALVTLQTAKNANASIQSGPTSPDQFKQMTAGAPQTMQTKY